VPSMYGALLRLKDASPADMTQMYAAISGGEPLPSAIREGFQQKFAQPIFEGYGLTETIGPIAFNVPAARRAGSVGRLVPGADAKITDDDGNALPQGQDGEVWLRGPMIMKGYHNLPKETAEALTPDGYFKSGDIGHLDADGYLVITDRKKDLLVTAGGKKVAPQPIENALKAIKYIAEAVLIGDQRPFVSALIVPNFDQLEAYARSKAIPYVTRADLIRHPQVRELFERSIAEVTKDLARFEQIKRFTLLERELSLDAGELTPTLKVRRKIVIQRNEPAIEEMYRGHATADVVSR